MEKKANELILGEYVYLKAQESKDDIQYLYTKKQKMKNVKKKTQKRANKCKYHKNICKFTA